MPVYMSIRTARRPSLVCSLDLMKSRTAPIACGFEFLNLGSEHRADSVWCNVLLVKIHLNMALFFGSLKMRFHLNALLATNWKEATSTVPTDVAWINN